MSVSVVQVSGRSRPSRVRTSGGADATAVVHHGQNHFAEGQHAHQRRHASITTSEPMSRSAMVAAASARRLFGVTV